MSDLVGNPDDRFSHDKAHMVYVNAVITLKLEQRNVTIEHCFIKEQNEWQTAKTLIRWEQDNSPTSNSPTRYFKTIHNRF